MADAGIVRNRAKIEATIFYAPMHSVGLVDDHLPGCFRYGDRGSRQGSCHQPERNSG